MNKYKIQCWFRDKRFEKEFEILDVEADTEDEARAIAREIVSYVFKTEVLEVNGVKSETEKQ